jgi:subtilisin family serine protease
VVRSVFTVLAGTVAVVLAGAAAPAGSVPGQQGGGQGLQGAGRYVVLMAAEPAAAYDGGVPGLQATSPRGGRRLHTHAPRVEDYVGFLRRQQGRVLRLAGVERGDVSRRYSYALNGFAAELSTAEAEALARQPRVAAVLKDRMRQPQTDNSPAFLGLSGPGGPWASGLLGEDVVVGVVDTGIWPEHPSFADDGTFPPLPGQPPLPCEFGNTAHNPDDAPFACNNKLLGARDMRTTYNQLNGPETYDSARDADGHGTHTASTAAGDADVDAEIFGVARGTVSGIAPRARVIAYKACGELGCVVSDTAAAIDQAVADGVDVINYSIGSAGSVVAPDAIAFLNAANAGVFVAASAGNDGPAAATISSPSTMPWVTSVGASTQDRAFEGSVTLGDGTRFTGASVTAGTAELPLLDAAALGNELCQPDVAFSAPVTGAIVLCKRGVNPRADKSRVVSEAGGAGMVLYDESDTAALVTDNHWVPTVHINNTDGLAVKEFIAASGDAATARIDAGERVPAPGSGMADFSSRGPNPLSADLIKPDVTAPGVNVLAGNSPALTIDAPGELFQSISGTSMSAPHVAGIYALLKQAHPDWTPAMAKSALMTTARQNVVEPDGATAADPFDDGAGHVSPGATGPGSMFQPGLVYDAGPGDQLAFLCGLDLVAPVVPDATCAALVADGFSTDAADLNYPSIGVARVAGRRTVTRSVTSVAAQTVTYTAEVASPPGFAVTVSPDRLTLAPGESADFAVTVTNDGGAPFGRFAFGSLTWTGGGFAVRSPIAVAASAFDAADLVQASGRSGRAGIGVRFGYTGGYAARAHGLVPRTLTRGSVAQDPDQTFDPADATGTTAHRFRVTRTAYLRWELTHPTRGVDLDVYLLDRAGTLVAASGAAGTDETVELTLPRAGVYTLYVHGWQTVTRPRERYTLRSWQVPFRPGRSLRVAATPDAATAGRAGRVTVSWRGLRAGAPAYFGAVTHHRGGRVLGMTTVRVAPRR